MIGRRFYPLKNSLFRGNILRGVCVFLFLPKWWKWKMGPSKTPRLVFLLIREPGFPVFHWHSKWATKKSRPYFPWDPGSLLKILFHGLWNKPRITGQYFIPNIYPHPIEKDNSPTNHPNHPLFNPREFPRTFPTNPIFPPWQGHIHRDGLTSTREFHKKCIHAIQFLLCHKKRIHEGFFGGNSRFQKVGKEINSWENIEKHHFC